jgi:hypothetical protein
MEVGDRHIRLDEFAVSPSSPSRTRLRDDGASSTPSLASDANDALGCDSFSLASDANDPLGCGSFMGKEEEFELVSLIVGKK